MDRLFALVLLLDRLSGEEVSEFVNVFQFRLLDLCPQDVVLNGRWWNRIKCRARRVVVKRNFGIWLIGGGDIGGYEEWRRRRRGRNV